MTKDSKSKLSTFKDTFNIWGTISAW